jgi:hypothetical protein
MTNIELRVLEEASRSATMWTQGYDGQTHHSGVLMALLPAFLILAVATSLMAVIL